MGEGAAIHVLAPRGGARGASNVPVPGETATPNAHILRLEVVSDNYARVRHHTLCCRMRDLPAKVLPPATSACTSTFCFMHAAHLPAGDTC